MTDSIYAGRIVRPVKVGHGGAVVHAGFVDLYRRPDGSVHENYPSIRCGADHAWNRHRSGLSAMPKGTPITCGHPNCQEALVALSDGRSAR